MAYTYDYPRPMVTVDTVIFGYESAAETGNLQVLLIERGNSPFKGQYAIPGGFIDMDEPADLAAFRELEEETGLFGADLKQFSAVSTVDRDPRGRTITIAYYALVNKSSVSPKAGDDAAATAWFDLTPEALPALAFDHDALLPEAYRALQQYASFYPLGRDLLPPGFKFEELLDIYRTILQTDIDREHLLKVFTESGVLVKAGGLYNFNEDAYNRALSVGLPCRTWEIQ